MHLMVYGEIIETPQVQYAKLLTENLPETLDCVYFTNSGAEATEGAMKLAKRFTGRMEMVAFKNAYHGSTQGALSIMGDEYFRNAYRPLLPGIHHVDYNDYKSLDAITTNTACIVAEVVQAEAGVKKANKEWLQAIRQRCTDTGTLLVLDEIQTGFGRTGSLWAFEQYGIVPDILLLGKALGGGMPLGAFIANKNVMQTLTANPVLGHISTFAGHPVCCAAGMAAFKILLEEKLVAGVAEKEELLRSMLIHPAIKNIYSAGLLMAVQFENAELGQKIIHQCVANGLITDWFLFAADCMRIAPPLVMTDEMIQQVCEVILRTINEAIKVN
jgi:acetylornithine/succinyldiaminopimelate/putrescine aminotransferase